MENSENRDLTMAGVTDQNTFFEPQKARNPSKYWGFWCRKWDSNPHGVLAQRILSPPRLPIPSFRQICYLKIGFSEIGGRFGGRFWKNAAIQFLKSPKLLVFLDFTRRSAQLILSSHAYWADKVRQRPSGRPGEVPERSTNTAFLGRNAEKCRHRRPLRFCRAEAESPKNRRPNGGHSASFPPNFTKYDHVHRLPLTNRKRRCNYDTI